MKIITNTEIIETRTKWARWTAPFTLILLFGGLFFNFLSLNQPEYFRFTLILLTLGFLFATVSSYLVNRWVREPRADQVLTNTLRKFGPDYALFNYTSVVSHVLLTPTRLYVIVVRPQKGEITVNKDRVSQKFTWGRLFKLFAEEGIGAPINEAQRGVTKLRNALQKELGAEQVPEIQALVIFSHKDVEFTSMEEPAAPVLRSNDLKTYLPQQNKQKLISHTQRATLAKILAGRWQEEQK
jgi:hypothetical protein